jgi:hypothetical protein
MYLVISYNIQHFTTFTPPRKLTKRVYTRPELSPLNFDSLGLRDQSAKKYFPLYLPAYVASQLLRTGVLVLRKTLVQIRQHLVVNCIILIFNY